MTENECVETLQYLLGYENAVDKGELDLPNYLNSEEKEALKFILEEIQQYRAIGTVEGYELAINESIDKHNLMIVYKDRLKEFEAIGTIEEFKALKEKAEPKKPQEISWGATNCPICGQEFGFNSHFNHCSNCGQKLDWQ